MYKAIFIDIDGTIRNNNKQLTEITKNAVKKVVEKGIFVILCSGRPRKYTEEVSRECNASNYIITSGGGNIYDYKENKNLYTNIMDKVACKELYDIAVKADIRFIMNVGDNRVVNKLESNYNGIEEELKSNIDEFLKENDVVQCVLADKDFDKVKSIEDKINLVNNVSIKNRHKSLIDETFPKEGTIYYDVANKDCSKGNSIIKLCEILDIDIKDTIAIGDDYNDLSMFNVVGLSVAMGNAISSVKEKADKVIASNEENGVAIFLEEMLEKM